MSFSIQRKKYSLDRYVLSDTGYCLKICDADCGTEFVEIFYRYRFCVSGKIVFMVEKNKQQEALKKITSMRNEAPKTHFCIVIDKDGDWLVIEKTAREKDIDFKEFYL